MSLRPFAACAAALLISLSPGSLAAHDDFRVIGTLTRHEKATVDVKNADGKTTSIRLDKQTQITRDKQKVNPTELQVGQSVVVDAYGDSERDLLALEIRIVPPISSGRRR